MVYFMEYNVYTLVLDVFAVFKIVKIPLQHTKYVLVFVIPFACKVFYLD